MELRLTIRKIDFASTIDQSIPKIREKAEEGDDIAKKLLSLVTLVSPAILKKMIGALPEDKQEAVAATLINSNQELLLSLATALAEEKGIIVELSEISAKAGTPDENSD